jgi:hypothetical protein
MATCRDIITYAMRQAKILGIGASPKTAEATEGMIALQSLYDQWRTGGMFGTLEDVYLDGDDIAEEGKRYFVPTGYTLTAPTSIYLDGNEEIRQPRDLSLYEALTQAGTQTAKVYDRTAWVSVLGLAQGDTAPLSSRNAHGLAACLAVSSPFVAIFGAEPSPQVMNAARQFTRSLMGKQGSTQNTTPGTYY